MKTAEDWITEIREADSHQEGVATWVKIVDSTPRTTDGSWDYQNDKITIAVHREVGPRVLEAAVALNLFNQD